MSVLVERFTVTIASGSSVSSAAVLKGKVPTVLQMPDGWDAAAISFITTGDGAVFRWQYDTALTGSFTLYNILSAMSAAILLGLDPQASLEGVLSHPGVPGRFQAVEEGQDFAVIVDYAHTPDSLQRVLETAREIAEGRVIVVFGCGGDRDRGKRPMMGEIAVRLADYAVITSDNPRSEDPKAIIAEIEEGALRATGAAYYRKITDRHSAIDNAVQEAGRGDVLIIAGKGHEKGQIFVDRIVPFDDVQEARQALKRRLGVS